MRKAIVGILTVLSGPALADPVVIAALGDSLTQGYGLPQEDGFVPQLVVNGVLVAMDVDYLKQKTSQHNLVWTRP